MDIKKALKLRDKQTVHCPEDRGYPAFYGTVVGVPTTTVQKNHQGIEYVWVTVQGTLHKSVWPSNRLG
jgi:hypothetical protein